ncbi:MAG: hypothetical protein JNN00_13790 [Chitinophagaceae bacterium]|nr:hypothetical protein [Chitinophagaceae bacterium]
MNYVENNDLLNLAHSLQKSGLNYDEISLQLREKGAPETLLQEIIEKVKSVRFLRKRKTGFLCCGVGVALLIIGCMITLLLYSSGSDIKFAMYGLTTIGVVFTFKGLIDIMGW